MSLARGPANRINNTHVWNNMAESQRMLEKNRKKPVGKRIVMHIYIGKPTTERGKQNKRIKESKSYKTTGIKENKTHNSFVAFYVHWSFGQREKERDGESREVFVLFSGWWPVD